MRVNLIAQPAGVLSGGETSIPVSLTVRPACGLPGDYRYVTDSAALLKMLCQDSDLPLTVLEKFDMNLHAAVNARLLGVELSESALTRIGYFID